MYDDFDMQDEYCGFEESDRDAWENEQVFQDTLLERDDWEQAEEDGFFDRDYDHDHGEFEFHDFE